MSKEVLKFNIQILKVFWQHRRKIFHQINLTTKTNKQTNKDCLLKLHLLKNRTEIFVKSYHNFEKLKYQDKKILNNMIKKYALLTKFKTSNFKFHTNIFNTNSLITLSELLSDFLWKFCTTNLF